MGRDVCKLEAKYLEMEGKDAYIVGVKPPFKVKIIRLFHRTRNCKRKFMFDVEIKQEGYASSSVQHVEASKLKVI